MRSMLTASRPSSSMMRSVASATRSFVMIAGRPMEMERSGAGSGPAGNPPLRFSSPERRARARPWRRTRSSTGGTAMPRAGDDGVEEIDVLAEQLGAAGTAGLVAGEDVIGLGVDVHLHAAAAAG